MQVGDGPVERRREVRWVRLDALHLTLRFLGPTPVVRVPDVEAAVRAAAAVAGPIGITIGGTGAFPPAGRPRVLWLGLRAGAEALATLASNLNDELVALGWAPDDRHLRAHLTLARADGVAAGPRTADVLGQVAAGLELPFVADRLTLFESVPVPGEPARYASLAEAPLGASPGGSRAGPRAVRPVEG